MKKIKKIITMCSVIFLFSSLSSQALAGNFEASNNKIFHNGGQINIRGVSWFGLESPPSEYTLGGLTHRDYKDMISQIKTMGFNAVRIPYCPGTLKNQIPTAINFENGMNSELAGKGTLEILDKVVNELNNQQIYALLDSHREDCKKIGNLWYTNEYSENNWIEDLKFVASRYKNTEYFIGIDLKNEPHGVATWGTGNASTDWNSAAERAGKAVNQTNSNILVFVQGIQDNPKCSSNTGHWLGGNLEPFDCNPIDINSIPSNKLVLSPHVYGPDVYQQQYFFDPNFPNNMESIWETHFGFLTNKGQTIVPGEWGGKYGNAGGDFKDKIWQDTLVNYFIKKGICSSFYWDLNPNSVDTGGILQDDWRTPWQNKLDLLKKYYSSCNNQTTNFVSNAQSVSSENTAGSNVEIYALGIPAGGIYPNLELLIDGNKEAEFSDVRGDVNTGSFARFAHKSAKKLGNSNSIEVRFVNDTSINGEDRNVRVDKIVIDGQVAETENGATYSEGSWSSANGCNGGNKQSEWLHCNGFFRYQPGTNTTTTNIVNIGETSDFTAEYYDNKNLTGSPKSVRKEQTIDYGWKYGQPDQSIPADNFSVRWIKKLTVDGGNYRFFTESDDGMRIIIDGQTVFDQWNDHAPSAFNFDKNLNSGEHEIRIEYYENGGEAVARMKWERI